MVYFPDFPPRVTLCVGAVVLRRDKVLFVRQAYGSLKGKWSLPWGFVEGVKPDGSPEPPDEAAIRETEEEAGVIAEVERLLGIQNHSTEEGELRLYLLYLCRHVSGEPTPDHRETDRAAYFSLDEMANSCEAIDEFCAWIVRRVVEGKHYVIPPTSQGPYDPHLAFL
jgi:ADP-ribose pyrophosphatase YjhB (NUDIX family)